MAVRQARAELSFDDETVAGAPSRLEPSPVPFPMRCRTNPASAQRGHPPQEALCAAAGDAASCGAVTWYAPARSLSEPRRP